MVYYVLWIVTYFMSCKFFYLDKLLKLLSFKFYNKRPDEVKHYNSEDALLNHFQIDIEDVDWGNSGSEEIYRIILTKMLLFR